jgi:hypothetical protein
MRGANRIADGDAPTYDRIDNGRKTQISRGVGASCFHGREAVSKLHTKEKIREGGTHDQVEHFAA